MAKNNYFQFKQFSIQQQHATMKVGTECVLLGAWADVENARSVLNIGNVNGLIALMVAQRSAARITAIDREKSAFTDASLTIH